MNYTNQSSENLEDIKSIHLLKILYGAVTEMQLISWYNKGVKFLLCIINVYSKYPWVVLLKDE